MSRLDWKEHTRGHWEADHCGMCLHVFKSLNGSCWSVYDQVIEIDGRGAMMPFEKAQASAVAAAERWSGNAHFTAVRETFRVLDARGQAPDDNAPLEVTVRRVLDLLDKVTAERDALKKRVADAPRITVFEMDGELCHSRPEPRDWRKTPKPIKHGDIVAWVRLEDGEK